jgi:hypothetical protein
MSTKEKLIARFRTLPKDFTFSELRTMLTGLGFVEHNKGKTSGSRVRFLNHTLKIAIDIHRPHTSGSPIKPIALKDIHSKLLSNNLI